ncbi:LexA family transcriptional regulator [Ruixingdingia sedimenti]|nr:helix-turn-helix transcriptional regulator [Xinfangfangia sp. LG-4]
MLLFRQNLGLRIEQCVKIIGKKSDAAAIAGVTAEQLNKWINGSVKVPVEALRLLAEAASSDFSWLATGEGFPDHPRPLQIRRAGLASVSARDQPDFIRLPFYRDVSASAGPGALAVSEQSDSVIAFARSFLRDHGAVPERCSIIRARGDSMSPTIPDASLLIVDHSQTEIANGCIMVLDVDGDLLVKRVHRRLNGMIDLVSDNPTYPPETLPPAALQQLRVIGRVVYFCRTP